MKIADMEDILRTLAQRPSLYPEEREAIEFALGRFKLLERVREAAEDLIEALPEPSEYAVELLVQDLGGLA